MLRQQQQVLQPEPVQQQELLGAAGSSTGAALGAAALGAVASAAHFFNFYFICSAVNGNGIFFSWMLIPSFKISFKIY